MQPSPIAETIGPAAPNFRSVIARKTTLQFAPERVMAKLIALIVLAAAVAGAQEHGYPPADVENGARLYQSSCAGCHGPGGEMVPGTDLQSGQFRRATTDAEVIRIIQSGIPGTTMPPSSFSEAQAGSIVAFLRSAVTAGRDGRGGRGAAASTGNAASGKA